MVTVQLGILKKLGNVHFGSMLCENSESAATMRIVFLILIEIDRA
jgi:hypothetical protein